MRNSSLVRLALGVVALLLLFELLVAWQHFPVPTTIVFRARFALLAAASAAILAAWLVSVVHFPILREAFGPFGSWISGSPLRAWVAALAVFELWLGLGQFLSAEPAFPEPVALLGATALIGAICMLVASKLVRWQTAASQEPASSGSSRANRPIRALATTVAIVAAASAATYVQFAYSLPLAIAADSVAYLDISEALLRGQELPLGHYTYPYPLIVALTRLIYDHVISAAVFQHLVRIATAATIFLVLQSKSYPIAWLASLLVALDPISTSYAHTVLTESLYADFLVLLVLLTYLLATSSQATSSQLALCLAALSSWV